VIITRPYFRTKSDRIILEKTFLDKVCDEVDGLELLEAEFEIEFEFEFEEDCPVDDIDMSALQACSCIYIHREKKNPYY